MMYCDYQLSTNDMAKIKREEYEVLKESQEKGYLLIARMKEGHLIRFREHRGKSERTRLY